MSSNNPRRSPALHGVRRDAPVGRDRHHSTEEQHSPAGCIAARMQRGFRHGLLALAAALLAVTAAAQDAERYGERLSRMPVDLRTTSAISGEGAVTAELVGNELSLTVRFSGLSAGVTAAHVHNAPVARRGGVAFPIDIGSASDPAGEIVDTVTLTDEQIAELRGERYYVQIHTETNPGGELRGWLLRRDD